MNKDFKRGINFALGIVKKMQRYDRDFESMTADKHGDYVDFQELQDELIFFLRLPNSNAGARLMLGWKMAEYNREIMQKHFAPAIFEAWIKEELERGVVTKSQAMEMMGPPPGLSDIENYMKDATPEEIADVGKCGNYGDVVKRWKAIGPPPGEIDPGVKLGQQISGFNFTSQKIEKHLSEESDGNNKKRNQES
jgi:hypothetical protein